MFDGMYQVMIIYGLILIGVPALVFGIIIGLFI